MGFRFKPPAPLVKDSCRRYIWVFTGCGGKGADGTPLIGNWTLNIGH
jgi:hypothetical protein